MPQDIATIELRRITFLHFCLSFTLYLVALDKGHAFSFLIFWKQLYVLLCSVRGKDRLIFLSLESVWLIRSRLTTLGISAIFATPFVAFNLFDFNS